MASRPVSTAKNGSGRVIGGALTRPSATLSQRERGWIWDGSHRPSATLSQRERGWIWDESHRPSATLSQRERGWVWDESHRPSATLSQRERGFDTACFAGRTVPGFRLLSGATGYASPLSGATCVFGGLAELGRRRQQGRVTTAPHLTWAAGCSRHIRSAPRNPGRRALRSWIRPGPSLPNRTGSGSARCGFPGPRAWG